MNADRIRRRCVKQLPTNLAPDARALAVRCVELGISETIADSAFSLGAKARASTPAEPKGASTASPQEEPEQPSVRSE